MPKPLNTAYKAQHQTYLEMYCPFLPAFGIAVAAIGGRVLGWGRVRDDHSTQREGDVHVAIVGNIAHAAPIGPSLVHFKLINDLHGTHLHTDRQKVSTVVLLCTNRAALSTEHCAQHFCGNSYTAIQMTDDNTNCQKVLKRTVCHDCCTQHHTWKAMLQIQRIWTHA